MLHFSKYNNTSLIWTNGEEAVRIKESSRNMGILLKAVELEEVKQKVI
jgi:hypothetical protein